MRALPLLLLLLLSACARVDYDIWRAKVGENMVDVVQGRDRGYFGYRRIIDTYTFKNPGLPRYAYAEPAHVSNYQVQRAVRGLGGTAWPDADHMTGAVDRLLYVLAYDPTPAVRAAACSQLGRIAERLPGAPVDPYPRIARQDEEIKLHASDLFDLQQKLEQGERVPQSTAVASLEKLGELYPTQTSLAMVMMRALSSRPIARAPAGPIRETLPRVAPSLCRRCISIALADISCGNPLLPGLRPDPSSAVRLRAIEVLTRLRDPVARDAAADRSWDDVDTGELDPYVRAALMDYLGEVGGARGFEAAVRRLDNDEKSVRLRAQQALITMTGARRPPSADAWRAWRREHPAWQGAAAGAPDDPSGAASAR